MPFNFEYKTTVFFDHQHHWQAVPKLGRKKLCRRWNMRRKGHNSGILRCTFQPESDVVLCVGVFEIFTHIFRIRRVTQVVEVHSYKAWNKIPSCLLRARTYYHHYAFWFLFFAVITGSEPRASSNNSKSRALLVPSLLQQSRKYCVPFFWP